MKKYFYLINAVCLLFLFACNTNTTTNKQTKEEPPPEPPYTRPECHVDCFGYIECHDGKVTQGEHNPKPCGSSCASAIVYTCKKGCRRDGKRSEDWLRPETTCEEEREKKEGDPCETEDDCLPIQVIHDKENNIVTNNYLQCDTAQGICVSAPAPVIEDYLQDCQLRNMSEVFPIGWSGHTKSGACRHQYCLLSSDPKTGCISQGCTKLCKSAHECPQGSLCDTQHRYWDNPHKIRQGVCVPTKLSLPCE